MNLEIGLSREKAAKNMMVWVCHSVPTVRIEKIDLTALGLDKGGQVKWIISDELRYNSRVIDW